MPAGHLQWHLYIQANMDRAFSDRAVIAIMLGAREPTCIVPLPSFILLVRAAINANDITELLGHDSADHTLSMPSFYAN